MQENNSSGCISIQLFCRCETGPKRSLYLVTKGARDVVVTNSNKVKFINMGTYDA